MWEKKQNTPQKRECHAKQNRKLSMPENTIFMELRLFSPGNWNRRTSLALKKCSLGSGGQM